MSTEGPLPQRGYQLSVSCVLMWEWGWGGVMGSLMRALNPLVEIPHHDSFPLPITLGKLLAFELGGTNFHPELSVPPIYSWARG